MVNTEIRQFRDSIIAITNASPLPIEIKRLVFSEIQTLINQEADKVIIAERKQANETKEKESVENGESIQQD